MYVRRPLHVKLQVFLHRLSCTEATVLTVFGMYVMSRGGVLQYLVVEDSTVPWYQIRQFRLEVCVGLERFYST